MNSSKILFFIFLMCSYVNYVFAGDSVSSLTKEYNNLFIKYGRDVVMGKTSSQFASSLPITIDADLRVEAIAYASGTITHTRIVYSELGYMLERNKLSRKEAKELLKKFSIKELCTTPDSRALLNNGITYTYNYYSNDRVFLFTNSFSIKECKE